MAAFLEKEVDRPSRDWWVLRCGTTGYCSVGRVKRSTRHGPCGSPPQVAGSRMNLSWAEVLAVVGVPGGCQIGQPGGRGGVRVFGVLEPKENKIGGR